MSKLEEIKNYLRSKIKDQDGVFYFLPEISEFQRQEIDFHNGMHQDEAEVHQLNSLRNKYYHRYFQKILFNLSKDSIILEIGSGSGFDLPPLLNRGYSIIASDISEASIKKSIQGKFNRRFNNQLLCLVADGQNLPFDDESFDAVFLAASFHHFENPKTAMKEIRRVTKKNGIIILAMEPSRFMMSFTKLFLKFKKLRIYQGNSAADETHTGFSKSDILNLLKQSAISNQQSIKSNVSGYYAVFCIMDWKPFSAFLN